MTPDTDNHESDASERDPLEPKICETCGRDGASELGYTQRFTADMKLLGTWCVPCSRKRAVSEYEDDRVLTTKLFEQAALENWRSQDGTRPYSGSMPDAVVEEICEASDALQTFIDRFEKAVWFGGMQTFARSASTKGTRFEAGKLLVLCFTMCGRAMVQIEEDGNPGRITLITEEDAPPKPDRTMAFEDFIHLTGLPPELSLPRDWQRRVSIDLRRWTALRPRGTMGLRGVLATEAQAITLLLSAIRAWKDREKQGWRIVEAQHVTMF
jgi:hypothetical protein